jgi:hypothetical protein
MMYIHHMGRLVRKQVYITVEQEQRLKQIAAREKRSEAEVIRAALDNRLGPGRGPHQSLDRDPLWTIVGLGKASAGPGDVSEHVDEHLYGARRK